MATLTSIASWTSHNLHLFLYLVETEETLRWQSIALLRKFSGLVSDRNLICRVTASRFLSSSDNFSNILYNTILRSKNKIVSIRLQQRRITRRQTITDLIDKPLILIILLSINYLDFNIYLKRRNAPWVGIPLRHLLHLLLIDDIKELRHLLVHQGHQLLLLWLVVINHVTLNTGLWLVTWSASPAQSTMASYQAILCLKPL